MNQRLNQPVSSGATQSTGRRAATDRLVRVGFVPLIDTAVLVCAAEQGFARREGISLQLIKDVSWSNIRDRLAFRQFDVAHMLSPMPVASQLGLGSNAFSCFAPFALGRGGNAITLSIGLYREMQMRANLDGSEDALTNALALKTVIEHRKQTGQKALVFGMTYPFSSHNYEFRFWMAAAGIDPDHDVTMIVVPPPMTVDAMASRAIDGFCVNAPWNMIAVEKGVGRVVATKSDIWPAAPEKVLGVNPDWAERNSETLSRLLVALDAAARWCDDPLNKADLADMLAEPAYIGGSANLMRRLLDGELTVDPNGKARTIRNYLNFHQRAANFPWISQALWIYSQMVRWGQVQYSDTHLGMVKDAYRPDLYRHALSTSSDLTPSFDCKVEGRNESVLIATSGTDIELDGEPFIDGSTFDPDRLAEYVVEFAIRASTVSMGKD